MYFSDVIYFKAGVKNPKILLDGNEYTIYARTPDLSRWRCNWYYKTKCKSRLVTYGNVVQVNIYGHNHEPSANVSTLFCSRQKLKIIRKTK